MAKQKQKKDVYYTNLRIPPKLGEKIKKAAENNMRSVNGEIEFTLTEKYL